MRSWGAALMLIGIGIASTEAAVPFGDWTVDVSEDKTVAHAATMNDSGAVFGEWCHFKEGTCVWMIAMSAECEDEESYPVLANSDKRAAPLTMTCKGKLEDTGLYGYVLPDYETVEAILESATRIGFALPMSKDQFRVVRFSLAGAHSAVDKMELLAVKMAEKKPNTRDTVM